MFRWNLVKARTIMTKDSVTIKKDSSIFDAMGLLVKHKISGLPVVNNAQELVGMITEKDIMQLLFILDDAMAYHKKVGEYMTKDVVCFGLEDSIVDICKCFIQHPFRRVPILDNGKLAGVVARRDIVSVLLASKKI